MTFNISKSTPDMRNNPLYGQKYPRVFVSGTNDRAFIVTLRLRRMLYTVLKHDCWRGEVVLEYVFPMFYCKCWLQSELEPESFSKAVDWNWIMEIF